jgi:hypothetical protein
MGVYFFNTVPGTGTCTYNHEPVRDLFHKSLQKILRVPVTFYLLLVIVLAQANLNDLDWIQIRLLGKNRIQP